MGRSGTFITLHTQMSRIAEEKNVDVFRFVQSMRSRRCLMVQTEAQYIFIHDAILEVLECGMTEVAARELPSQYKYLQTVDEASGKTLLQLELQVRVSGRGEVWVWCPAHPPVCSTVVYSDAGYKAGYGRVLVYDFSHVCCTNAVLMLY